MKTKKMLKSFALIVGIMVMMAMLLGPSVEVRLNPPEKAEAATTILSRDRNQAQELRAKGVKLLTSVLLDERQLDKAREARSLLYDSEQLYPDPSARFSLRVYQWMASEVLAEPFMRFSEDEQETVHYLLRKQYPNRSTDWVLLVRVIENTPGRSGIAHIGSPWRFPMMGAYQALGWGSARQDWMDQSGRMYATALRDIVRKGETWGSLAYGMTREPEILARAVGPNGKVFGSELNDDQLGHLRILNENRDRQDTAQMIPIKAQLDRCTLSGKNLDGIAIHQFLHIWGTSIGPEGQYDVQRVGAYFRTVRDALRPGGKLIVLDSNPSREVARAIMEEAGLHEVSFGSPDSNSDYHQGGTYRAVYQRP